MTLNYLQLAHLHLLTILPAFGIGTYLMLTRKGTRWHRRLGKIYMALMLITCCLTLSMSAHLGPTLFGHFGLLHGLSFFTIFCVITAYTAVRHGLMRLHIANMVGIYVGGLIIPGAFALLPSRTLGQFIFG